MLFTISGKHIEITESIRKHADEKTSKLPKYYNSINRVEVIIDGNQGGNTNVEIIAKADDRITGGPVDRSHRLRGAVVG